MLRIFTKEINLAEEELIIKNRELDQFSRVASHDLKEPLRTISGFSSLIIHKFTNKVSPDLDQYAQFINNASLRMSTLLDDLLIHTTIDKRQFGFSEVDMNNVINQVRANLKSQIEINKATLIVSKLPVVWGLESRLVQLFQNLISNAIKFKQDALSPQVIVTHTIEKAHNIIEVKDNGIGIPKHQEDKVFESFHRVHSKDKYEGSGIGLATCKKIVEIHNGKITLNSKENIGTSIIVSIPISARRPKGKLT